MCDFCTSEFIYFNSTIDYNYFKHFHNKTMQLIINSNLASFL